MSRGSAYPSSVCEHWPSGELKVWELRTIFLIGPNRQQLRPINLCPHCHQFHGIALIGASVAPGEPPQAQTLLKRRFGPGARIRIRSDADDRREVNPGCRAPQYRTVPQTLALLDHSDSTSGWLQLLFDDPDTLTSRKWKIHIGDRLMA